VRALRPIELAVKHALTDTRWQVSLLGAAICGSPAYEFCKAIEAIAYRPDYLINVVPAQNLLYVVVPKAASTRIRSTLAAIDGRHRRSLKPSQRRKLRGPRVLRDLTANSFYGLVSSRATLRFSFVRNPYARLLSCWADKFQGKPLIPSNDLMSDYLSRRYSIDPRLPAGADRTLSFPNFVTYAAASAAGRYDPHLQLQHDVISVPGIELDLVGKVESFANDFSRVLQHVGANELLCRQSLISLNESAHEDWRSYYTADLADRVYYAYERDFDHLRYPRMLADTRPALERRIRRKPDVPLPQRAEPLVR
jgi:hypothetical protein